MVLLTRSPYVRQIAMTTLELREQLLGLNNVHGPEHVQPQAMLRLAKDQRTKRFESAGSTRCVKSKIGPDDRQTLSLISLARSHGLAKPSPGRELKKVGGGARCLNRYLATPGHPCDEEPGGFPSSGAETRAEDAHGGRACHLEEIPDLWQSPVRGTTLSGGAAGSRTTVEWKSKVRRVKLSPYWAGTTKQVGGELAMIPR
jgi:hypothetical protein